MVKELCLKVSFILKKKTFLQFLEFTEASVPLHYLILYVTHSSLFVISPRAKSKTNICLLWLLIGSIKHIYFLKDSAGSG